MTDLDELIAEARRLEGDYSDNHEVVTHMSALADALEASTRAPVQGEPECECWPTEEKYHFVYFGATEPGSAFEYNPECPEHGEPNDDVVLAALNAYEPNAATPNIEDWGEKSAARMRRVIEVVSRATAPDAATEIARSLAMASAITGADAEVIAGASVKMAALGEIAELHAERDAALDALAEVRDILNRDDFGDDWEHDEWVYREAAEKKLDDIEAALDGAHEPEAEEEMYQAGCGSWDCRAPECGRA